MCTDSIFRLGKLFKYLTMELHFAPAAIDEPLSAQSPSYHLKRRAYWLRRYRPCQGGTTSPILIRLRSTQKRSIKLRRALNSSRRNGNFLHLRRQKTPRRRELTMLRHHLMTQSHLLILNPNATESLSLEFNTKEPSPTGLGTRTGIADPMPTEEEGGGNSENSQKAKTEVPAASPGPGIEEQKNSQKGKDDLSLLPKSFGPRIPRSIWPGRTH